MTGLFAGLDLPALATGLAAAACLTSAPLFRGRRAILLAQLVAGICFAAHYACLGITAAAAANVLGAVQTLAALFAARSVAMNRLGYVLVALMVLSGVLLWQGPISALSIAAMSLIALGRMQANELRLRLMLLAGGGFWMLHDYIGEAWIALFADIGAAAAGAAALTAMLVRITIEWRPAIRGSVPA